MFEDKIFWGIISLIVGGISSFFIRQKIARHNSNRREDRDLVDNLCDEIEKVEELSHDYYKESAQWEKAQETRIQINRLLKRIGSKTHTLSGRIEDNFIPRLQLQFKQFITLGDFESIDRDAKKPGDPIFGNISDAGRKLIAEMERVLQRKYRKKSDARK